MRVVVVRLCLLLLLLAAHSCTQQADDKTAPQAAAQTQALVMAAGWVSGSGWPTDTLVALNSVNLRTDTSVIGDVAVIRARSGGLLSVLTSEAALGGNVELRGNLRADSVNLQWGAHVFGNATYNSIVSLGVIDGVRKSSLTLPLTITVPNVPNFTSGSTAVTVNSTVKQTLAAGSYGDVRLRAGTSASSTVLTLSGGVYALNNLTLEDLSRVECSAACEVRVKGRLTVGSRAYVGPAASSSLAMSAVQLIIEGADSSSVAAEIGSSSELKGFVFVPNGTLALRSGSNSIGKFLAKDIDAGSNADIRDGTGVVNVPGGWVTGQRWPQPVVTALNSVEIGLGAQIRGDVAVITAATGATLTSGYEAALALSSVITGNLSADSVQLPLGSRVTGRVSYNNLSSLGSVGSVASPLALPLDITAPAFPAFSGGTTGVDVAATADRTLAAGDYALIKLRSGNLFNRTVVTLSGGIYNVADLDIGDYVNVECAAACEVRVKNRVVHGGNGSFGPKSGSGLDTNDVRIFVEGKNGGSGVPDATPYAASFGASTALSAFVFVPNGTLALKSSVAAKGRLVARDIDLAELVKVEAAGAVITPPSILTQPASVTVRDGDSATFTVTATGTSVAYQWQRDGIDMPGATSASYTKAPATIADNGAKFRVVVSNAAASVVSSDAILTVNPVAPSITTQPGAVTVNEGQSASFSCAASGSAPTYQWQKNGVNIAGKTATTLTMNAVVASDAGNYACVASNAAGSATSNAAQLTVKLLAPTIIMQPGDQRVTEGQTASFSVYASGSSVSYQWRSAGQPIVGATSTTLTLANVAYTAAGAYDCVVTNSGGSVTTRAASLTVDLRAPVITKNPSAVTATEGGSAAFSCTASGTLVTYQWQKGGADIAGANAATFTISPVRDTDAGAYRCVALNSGGSAVSSAATLSVNLIAPVITEQPAALTVNEKEVASFSCNASGTSVSYRWQKNAVDIAGANARTFTVASAVVADAGDYRCIASNSAGAATSNAAALRVNLLPPQITTQPSALSVKENDPVSFTCAATGTQISFRWQKDSVDIAGATSATYSLAKARVEDAGAYRCVVTNSGGTVSSTAAALTVTRLPPVITTQPVARTVTEHTATSFSCAASGTEVTYRWQKNGQDIAASSGATYSIADVLSSDAGNYACVATNSGGSATSQAATLTVKLVAPVITTQPVARTATEHTAASFSCAASGTSVTYRWQKNGQDIAGSSGSTYAIADVQATDAGNYACVATNSGGSVTSQAAALTVTLLAPVITSQPVSRTATEHSPTSFTCAASGTSVSYRWQKNGQDIAASSGATYTIADVLSTDAGDYACVATNTGGSVTSQAASLTVKLLPPVITTQPVARAATEHTATSFTCAASGTSVSYRWQKNGQDIPGTSGSTYAIADVLGTDAGDYACVATNTGGTVTSQGAALTVKLLPPVITKDPAALTVIENQPAAFSCTATGTAVSYRWQKGGQDIAGATGASYTIASAQNTDAGDYRCVVSNTGGSVNSQVATLTVQLLPPRIVGGPSSLTVTENEPASFSCTASGTLISYRWLKNDAPIAGAVGQTYSIAKVVEGDEGAYRCVVTNSAGSATSDPATLNVQALPPAITQQPSARTALEHAAVSFTCAASGSGVTYRWQKDGVDISGAAAASFNIPDVLHTAAGAYRCIATNESGSATSDAAPLTVKLIAPTITRQPLAITADEHSAASFSCEASGTLVEYRWQKAGADIAGAIGPTFAIAEVSYEDRGDYRCVVSNTGGSATSEPAALSVQLLAPKVAAGPLSLRVYEHETATFHCLGEGTLLSYQWQKDDADLPGAITADLTLVAVSPLDAGAYRCVIRNSGGGVVSQPATLTVDLLPPNFPTQPASVTVTEGEAFQLTCTASGTSLSFQWEEDGAPLAAATSAVYAVETAQTSDAGVYRCTATNSGGSATSADVPVIIHLRPPVITVQPTDASVNEGQSYSFSVTAQGTELRYQWQRNGADIPSATEATYTREQAVTSDDGATYRVVVSNSGGSVFSRDAALQVTDATAPTLSVNGETEVTVTGDTFTISGSAGDSGSGIREILIRSDRLPGQDLGVVFDSAGAFTGDIPLSLGTNTVTVIVRDARGNETTKTITITVQAVPLPEITFLSPANGATVQTGTITVEGRVRSTLPASEIRLQLGSSVLYPSGTGPDYSFTFDHVRLTQGPNQLTVTAQTTRGSSQASLTVNYGTITPPPDDPKPPVIQLQVGTTDQYFVTDAIPVAGSVMATRCVQSITVNGAATSFIGSGTVVTFSTTLSFAAAGSDDLGVVVRATDCDAQSSTTGFIAHRDSGAPVITVNGLQLAPAVNTVLQTPYRLSGTISDTALAGFTISNQSIGIAPTGTPGQWTFSVDVPLQRLVDWPLTLEAWDAAGQRSTREVILRLDANLKLEILSPTGGAQLLVSASAGQVQVPVTARAIGMAVGDVVFAQFDALPRATLTRSGSSAQGVVSVASSAGTHTLKVSVESAQGTLLAQSSITIELKDQDSIPVAVTRQEPAADSSNIEANAPITLHFNRAIDPNKLTLSVLETAHGKMFAEQPPGADLTQLSVVSLVDVDRSREPVPGEAQNFPENRMISFYPSRDYAYGGTVFVDVRYDDNDLWHAKFYVRPLPTLVHGFVANQAVIPLQGIEVSLPQIARTAISNDDGNWNFGYGDPPELRIPPGRYRAIVNPARKSARFGTIERFIEISDGVAYAGTILIPELNSAEPFRHIASGQTGPTVLAHGDVTLDLAQAVLRFPDGLPEGDVHVQFLSASQLGHSSLGGARPDWAFGVQPPGVEVDGNLTVNIQLPQLDQSYAYLDKWPDRVVMVGLDRKSLQIAPVGVAQIDRTAHTARAVGPLHLQSLDYLGVSSLAGTSALLNAYVAQDIDLSELIRGVEAQ